MGEVIDIDSRWRAWLAETYPDAYRTLLEAEALERAESAAENEALRGPRKAGDSG
jgi:hypothetical protein